MLNTRLCTKSTLTSTTTVVYNYIVTRTLQSASSNNDDDNDFASLIIQDKDLLNPSRKSSGTGLHVLDLIIQGSLQPDRAFYNMLLKKCTRSQRMKQGRIVHSHLLDSHFKYDLVVQNTILNMYAKCGCLEEARKLFDEMPEKDFVTWTALITGYSQNDQPRDALVLFSQMLSQGFEPNEFTLSSVLKAAADEPCKSYGRQVHGFALKSGNESNVYVGSSLLDMYARCDGLMHDAELMFDALKNKNEVSWNALIAGYTRKGDGEQALQRFLNMLREGFEPTTFTYSSLFDVCASRGFLEQGRWIHAHMMKFGEKLTAFVGNTLLYMYAKSGSIKDARKVFDRLSKRDVVSWNSMLTAYAQHGLGKEAVQVIKEMLKARIAPNYITFLALLTACSHSGLVSEGHHYFALMKKYNLEPQIEHYVSIVDLLGRAGDLNGAEKFIREMPMEPTAAVWKALLGACRMHKNIELGSYAAKRVFELDPDDSGPHVLLYNIFSSAGRWSDAARVRKMMRESGVKKEPACSWVEIENTVHTFMANDDAHPQREEICKKWEEISEKIKQIGYVPDSSHVLAFVDQQERDAKLQYHSEKLAVAFAILNTPSGSTIRVKKNIRICGDCHSAIKFVSKLLGREIIVRDTNRFHHFNDGSCSCGDYW